MKKIIIVFIILIAIVWYFMPNDPNGGNFENDKRIFEKEWSSPTNEEISKIAKVLIDNHISGCGEFFVKEINTNEYIIACHIDEGNWKYMVAWPSSGTIDQVSVEMELKLEPPY